MYNHMQAIGDFICIYFLFLMLIGSFFLLNLILAVIMQSFFENDRREKIKLKELKLQVLATRKAKLKKLQREAILKKKLLRKLFKRSRSQEESHIESKNFPVLINSIDETESEEGHSSKPNRPSKVQTSCQQISNIKIAKNDEVEKNKRKSIKEGIESMKLNHK